MTWMKRSVIFLLFNCYRVSCMPYLNLPHTFLGRSGRIITNCWKLKLLEIPKGVSLLDVRSSFVTAVFVCLYVAC